MFFGVIKGALTAEKKSQDDNVGYFEFTLISYISHTNHQRGDFIVYI